VSGTDEERSSGRPFPRWLVALVVVVVVGFVLYELRGVLTPVFFAFLIAYMLDPVVDRFESMGVPRAAGITILLTLVLGGIALFVVLAVPGIVQDVADFSAVLPGKVEAWLAEIEPELAALGVEVPHNLDEALAQLQMDTSEAAERAVEPVTAVLGWIVGGTASALGAIAGLIMVPIFAFYLLYSLTAGAQKP